MISAVERLDKAIKIKVIKKSEERDYVSKNCTRRESELR